MAIPSRTLPRGGPRLSRLGIGTVQFGTDYGFTKAKSQGEADAILDACAARGIYLLDTAPAYGDSEAKIGDYLRRQPQSGFVVATKLGTGSPHASVAASLKTLGLTRLELLQLHRSDPAALADDRLWTELAALRAEGLFVKLGVSVYEAPEIETILARHAAEVDFVQLPYSVFDQRLRPWLPRLRSAGIGVVSRSTLLKGMIPAADDQLPSWLAGLKPTKARLRAMAERAGLDAQSLALLSCALEPDIDCTLIGVDSPAEVHAAANALDAATRVTCLEAELRTLAVSDPELVDPRLWAARGFR